MAGKIKKMIDKIVEERSKGNKALVGLTKAKIAMKGIIPDQFTETSADDPVVIEKLTNLAKDLNINL
ncbi:MAG: hypothetical protein Q8942_15865 [Bacillota bacterium]|nr:hypothetical protein [Bacillota bacterium]